MEPGLFTLVGRDGDKFKVYDSENKCEYTVILEQVRPGKANLVGLPPVLEPYTFNFTAEDIFTEPQAALECIITMHKGEKQEVSHILPSEADLAETLSSHVEKINTEDPSLQYDVVGRIGQGGFGKIYSVRRKADKAILALKFIPVNTEKERTNFTNEIGIMKQLDHPNILKL